jgi:phage baseplate assembly protein W
MVAATPDRLFGTDLQVVPNAVAQDASALDLLPAVRIVRRPRAGEPQAQTDLATLDGRDNLAQALLLRLLTPRGALATLGHADYGSRLTELIGRGKTDALRLLCRAYVLEAVAQEPRVRPQAVALRFEPEQEQIDSFVFTLAVQPITAADAATLTLQLEVGL